MNRILPLILLIAVLIGIGVAIDRILIGTTVYTTTLYKTSLLTIKEIELKNESFLMKSKFESMNISLEPRTLYIKPFIFSDNGILNIHITYLSRAKLRIYIAIETNSSLSIVSPQPIKKNNKEILLSLPISRGLGAIVIVNDGPSDAVFNLVIEIKK